jgi:hypothetical protein
VFVTAFAHIVMNNASASLGYLFVIQDRFLANLGTVLVMVVVVGALYATGQLRIFRTLVPNSEPGVEP